MNSRVALGIAKLEDEAALSRSTTTGTGGFGIKGITTFGASTRNGIPSGCSKGSTITTPNTTTCKPIDASIVHRLLKET
jgi:hypothetical protein